MSIGRASGAGGSVTRYSAAELVSRLLARYGADLLLFGIGDSVTVTGTDITAAPSLVGPDLANSHASNRFTRGTRNYHRSVTQASSADRSLIYDDVSFVMLSAWLICVSPAQPFAADRNGMRTVTGGGSPEVVQGVSGDVVLDSTDWAHYINGSASETMPAAGVTIVEAVNALNTDTGVEIGGLSGSATTGWVAPFLGWLCLARESTAGERSATVADFKNFFRIFG